MKLQPKIKDIKHHYAGTFILTESGKIIGQKRDNKSNIDNPGKISTFGGTVEPGETPVVGAWRELTQEETNLKLVIDDLRPLLEDIKWRELTKEWEVLHFFTVKISNKQLEDLEIYEGAGWCYIDGCDDDGLIDSWRPIVKKAFDIIFT